MHWCIIVIHSSTHTTRSKQTNLKRDSAVISDDHTESITLYVLGHYPYHKTLLQHLIKYEQRVLIYALYDTSISKHIHAHFHHVCQMIPFMPKVRGLKRHGLTQSEEAWHRWWQTQPCTSLHFLLAGMKEEINLHSIKVTFCFVEYWD